AYGAEIVLTPRLEGMKGAMAKAIEIKESISNAWIPSQFDNPANPRAHINTTSKEIIRDFPEGIDFFITGVGTGGHISGVGKVLKGKFPEIIIYAVEPDSSAVISGGDPGPHPLQGIGAGFIPSNLDTKILNGSIIVSMEEAYDFVRRAAREEGLFVGISTGASLAAIAKSLDKFKTGSRILTFGYDTGERYLSVDDLF
ncbi:MAG: pyridoxal-phosphate dependent enzyme, partial [Bacteroidales bacterium]|nr:pyridoxal-phosphate dependent enzyme [Bacteroidales bacterium]